MISPTPYLSVLLATVIFMCADGSRLPLRHSAFVEKNLLSPVAKYGGGATYEIRDWVRIKYSGPRMNRVAPGGRVELECEANGSPPPNVQWYHYSNPISQGMDENNSIGGLRLGNIKSRLIIDCVTASHHGTYTCVATSGAETAASQPSLLFVQGNNASGLQPSCTQALTNPPRIVTWSPNTMETIGNDVFLPCVSVGTPRPQVYWIDGQNNLITSDEESQSDERYKVLDTGDLMISSVRWADMGQYTCVAESALGRDTITTFLYPMSKDR